MVAPQDEEKNKSQEKTMNLEAQRSKLVTLEGENSRAPRMKVVDDEEQDYQNGDDDGQDARAPLFGRQDIGRFRHARPLSGPPGRRPPLPPGNRPPSRD